MAAPKKPKDEHHSAAVRLLFRPADLELVKTAAALKSLSVSAWARLHLLPLAKREIAEASED